MGREGLGENQGEEARFKSAQDTPTSSLWLQPRLLIARSFKFPFVFCYLSSSHTSPHHQLDSIILEQSELVSPGPVAPAAGGDSPTPVLTDGTRMKGQGGSRGWLGVEEKSMEETSLGGDTQKWKEGF